MNDPTSAYSDYTNALRLDGQNDVYHNNLGNSLLNMHRY
jgi:Flp pilus assembly protein TadD